MELPNNWNWDQPTFIRDDKDWPIYIENVNHKLLKQYVRIPQRHIGIPMNYPCIVISWPIDNFSIIEHKFVYARDALDLVRYSKVTENLFVRMMLE